MSESRIKESCHKSSNLWLPSWNTLLDPNSEDIIVRMKRTLIYYPKHPLAIKPISSEIATELVKSHSSGSSLLRKLYCKITSRYNSELLTHHNLNTTCLGSKLWKKYKATKFLKLQQDRYHKKEEIDGDSSAVLKKAIRGSKCLEILELDGFTLWAEKVLKELKYVNSLKTLKIKDFQDISLDTFKKSIFASRLSLETVTFSGEIMKLSNPIEMWRIILELPKLKKFNIDCSSDTCDYIFDVNTIPFNILRKRNISFDIRVPRENDTPEFSLPNKIGLSNLNILGINFSWRGKKPTVWDYFKDENVQTQESFQRSLFLDLESCNEAPATTTTNQLAHLFQTCKNISILVLSLAMYRNFKQEQPVFFKDITNLVRLRHIAVKLDDTIRPIKSFMNRQSLFSRTRDLFKHLQHCASSLESITLHIDVSGERSDSKDTILGFFEACSNTLKCVTFIFMSTPYFSFCERDTDIFYNALSKLKQITSLKLAFEGRYSDSNFESQFHHLEKLVLAPYLKELTIFAPLVSSEELKFNTTNIESLTKLTIDCCTLSLDSSVYSTIIHFSKTLKHLDLRLKSLSKEIWYKLLNLLDFLSVLETLKLKTSILDISEKEARSEMKMKIKSHPSLKVAVFTQGEDSVIDIESESESE